MSGKFPHSILALLILLFFAGTSDAQRAGKRKAVPAPVRPVPSEDPIMMDTVISVVESVEITSPEKVKGTEKISDTSRLDEVLEGIDVDEMLVKATDKSVLTRAINKKDITDAYPYLSSDGLRLYFTSNREGGHGRLFISTRASVQEAFGEPRVLSKNLTDPFYAGTLTADELNLYVARNGNIYVSRRASMNDEFGKPIKLEELEEGWLFAPAISPDGSELVVTTTPAGKNYEVNILYRKDVTGKFMQVDILPSPEGMDAGPAQFSKDGLTLYCSLEQEKDNVEKLFLYRRNSLNDRFIDMEPLAESLNVHTQCLQPSVNADETILVYVISNGGWTQDEIVLVNMEGKNKSARMEENGKLGVQQKINTSNSHIYPNPFQAWVVLQLENKPAEDMRFILYDVTGKMVRQETITQMKTNIELEKLPGGTYIFQVMNSEGKIVSSGKLVRN